MSGRELDIDVAATLAELVAGQRRLEEEVRAIREALEARRPAPDAAGEALLQAIYAHVGSTSFSVAELMKHALAGSPELRAALAEMNGRKLGRALRRLRNRELAGLVLIRESEDSFGVVWRIFATETPETTAARVRFISGVR
jgi:hypothetical protein